MRIGVRQMGLAFTLGLLLPLMAAAQKTSPSEVLKPEIRDLLERSWDRTPEAEQAVRSWTQGAQPSRSSRDAYALGLLELQHLNYRDAVDQFTIALRKDPRDPHLLQAYIYGKILIRQARQATPRLETWAASLARAAAREDSDVVPELDALGLLFGYLELPTTPGVNQRELERQGKLIREHLADDDARVFESARESVHRLYESLIADQAEREDLATAEAEDERERELARLDEEQARLNEAMGNLAPRLDQLRDDRQEDLDAIRDRAAPVQEQLATTSGQLAALDAQLWNLDQDLGWLYFFVGREPDRWLRRRMFWEIDRLQGVASQVEADWVALNAQAQGLANQQALLQQQYQVTQRDYDLALGELNQSWQQLQKQLKINRLQVQRLMKPLRARTGPSEALGQKAKTLSTYFEFPLESERLRLLSDPAPPEPSAADDAKGLDMGSGEGTEPTASDRPALILDGTRDKEATREGGKSSID